VTSGSHPRSTGGDEGAGGETTDVTTEPEALGIVTLPPALATGSVTLALAVATGGRALPALVLTSAEGTVAVGAEPEARGADGSAADGSDPDECTADAVVAAVTEGCVLCAAEAALLVAPGVDSDGAEQPVTTPTGRYSGERYRAARPAARSLGTTELRAGRGVFVIAWAV